MEFTGYIARETDNAVAFVMSQDADKTVKPLWVPRKKIDEITELDEPSKAIQLAGENVKRQATPVILDIDNNFLRKIGVA